MNSQHGQRLDHGDRAGFGLLSRYLQRQVPGTTTELAWLPTTTFQPSNMLITRIDAWLRVAPSAQHRVNEVLPEELAPTPKDVNVKCVKR
jgi:hypothetical protein